MGEKFYEKLMSEVYDDWLKNKDLSYIQFIDSLDEKHKEAVLVGDLNLQVIIGGFDRWNSRGRTDKVGELFRILNEFVNDTNSVAGKRVIKLLRTYLKISNRRSRKNYQLSKLDLINREYYKIHERFLKDFDVWLIKKHKEGLCKSALLLL